MSDLIAIYDRKAREALVQLDGHAWSVQILWDWQFERLEAEWWIDSAPWASNEGVGEKHDGRVSLSWPSAPLPSGVREPTEAEAHAILDAFEAVIRL